MKLINIFLQLNIFLALSLVAFAVPSQAIAANFSFSPSTGTLSASGTQIKVDINSGGATLKSASVVFTYDPEKVTVTAASGSYFPVVSQDTTTAGELVISGTLTIGDSVGVTGNGTIATLTVTPKVSSGTVNLNFRCSAAQTDDSNIINMADENLLSTDGQCGANVNGTYTIGGASAPAACNSTCLTNSDCSADLVCSNNFCRNATCPDATNCSCASTGAQPTMPESLPVAGPEAWATWIFTGLAALGMGVILLLLL
jgi:hypothetical protein